MSWFNSDFCGFTNLSADFAILEFVKGSEIRHDFFLKAGFVFL